LINLSIIKNCRPFYILRQIRNQRKRRKRRLRKL